MNQHYAFTPPKNQGKTWNRWLGISGLILRCNVLPFYRIGWFNIIGLHNWVGMGYSLRFKKFCSFVTSYGFCLGAYTYKERYKISIFLKRNISTLIPSIWFNQNMIFNKIFEDLFTILWKGGKLEFLENLLLWTKTQKLDFDSLKFSFFNILFESKWGYFLIYIYVLSKWRETSIFRGLETNS